MAKKADLHSLDLSKIRHHIHSIAEVAREEDETASYIHDLMASADPDDITTGLGGNGLVVRFKGDKEGPTVMIRCELDALPIPEENDLDYLSKNEGNGHKCGHDGHMAILCGVAKEISSRDSFSGELQLLFQPAEETGNGAKRVLNDDDFSQFEPDYIFALHNIPGYEKGNIIIRKDTFAAASVGFAATLKGTTSHAAHPEEGKSPAPAVAQLIQSFSAASQYYAPLEKAAKVTVIQAHLGEKAYGTSPGRGEVSATLRTYDDDLLDKLRDRVEALAEDTAGTYDLELETEWVESFPATVNEADSVELIAGVAKQHDIGVIEKEAPFSWSEDFGHFTDAFTGAMFGLASGKDQPALHAADYDFPDEIIETGVTMFTGIFDELGNKH